MQRNTKVASFNVCRMELEKINVEDFFEPLHNQDAPCGVRLEGPPGAGTTTLLRHMVHSWSTDFLQWRRNVSWQGGPPKWTLMVYIQARAIKTTVEQALQDHLWCEEKDVPLLTDLIKQGDKVLIFIDGEDELWDDGVIEILKTYVHERQTRGGAKFLFSSRSYLSSINSKDFNRFLVLKGFTTEQGEEYIHKVLSNSRQANHLKSPILQYVKRHKYKLESLLSNPLRLHIFCTLTRKGFLNFAGDAPFKTLDLFEPLERFVLRREGGDVTVDQSQKFYQVCLHAYLLGFREIPDHMIKKFNVTKNYLAFLEKETNTNIYAATSAKYSFSHETIYEYFVSKSIGEMSLEQSKPYLLHIFSKKIYHNIQEMIIEIILRNFSKEIHFPVILVRSLLVLQIESSLQRLPMAEDLLLKIQKSFSVEEILSDQLSKAKLREANVIWEEINMVFDNGAEKMRATDVFCNLYQEGIIDHIVRSFHVATAKQQFRIIRGTLLRLLPSQLIFDDT